MTDTYANLDRLTNHYTLKRFLDIRPVSPNLLALSTAKREQIEICEAVYTAYMTAATSSHAEICMTRFRNHAPTTYSILGDTLTRLLVQLLDGNRRRAQLVRDVMLDCGESVYYCYEYCAARNWRSDRIL